MALPAPSHYRLNILLSKHLGDEREQYEKRCYRKERHGYKKEEERGENALARFRFELEDGTLRTSSNSNLEKNTAKVGHSLLVPAASVRR